MNLDKENIGREFADFDGGGVMDLERIGSTHTNRADLANVSTSATPAVLSEEVKRAIATKQIPIDPHVEWIQ